MRHCVVPEHVNQCAIVPSLFSINTGIGTEWQDDEVVKPQTLLLTTKDGKTLSGTTAAHLLFFKADVFRFNADCRRSFDPCFLTY